MICPRRFSPSFIKKERLFLAKRRTLIRQLQVSAGVYPSNVADHAILPREVPLYMRIGQHITVLNSSVLMAAGHSIPPGTLLDGIIYSVDRSNHRYEIILEKKLGRVYFFDHDIMSHGPDYLLACIDDHEKFPTNELSSESEETPSKELGHVENPVVVSTVVGDNNPLIYRLIWLSRALGRKYDLVRKLEEFNWTVERKVSIFLFYFAIRVINRISSSIIYLYLYLYKNIHRWKCSELMDPFSFLLSSLPNL